LRLPVADPDQGFGKADNRWGHKKIFFKGFHGKVFMENRKKYHTKVVSFVGQEGGYFCWPNYALFQAITIGWVSFFTSYT